MEILDLKGPIHEDESLTRFEYHNVLPYSSHSFNNNDEIRILIHQQDIITLPSESRLYVEGTLRKTGELPLAPEDGLADNAIPHLFSEIRYELNGIVIDRVRNPGITSLLKGLLSYTTNDTPTMTNSSFKILDKQSENFSFCVPLNTLLGFAEDYKKVLFNVKQELILTRSRTDNNAIVDSAGNKQLTITLNVIQWQVPFVNVNDTYRLNFLNLMQKNIPIQMAFRTWQLYEYPNLNDTTSSISWPVRLSSAQEKPRFIITGFQTQRKDQLQKSASVFDQCNIRQMRLFIGSECYPYVPLTANFTQHQIAVLYENFLGFRKKYYHTENPLLPTVCRNEFLNSYPIWVIDCSRQNEIIKSGSVDIRLDIDGKGNFPANTTAHCLIISDSLVEYIPFTGIVRIIV